MRAGETLKAIGILNRLGLQNFKSHLNFELSRLLIGGRGGGIMIRRIKKLIKKKVNLNLALNCGGDSIWLKVVVHCAFALVN